MSLTSRARVWAPVFLLVLTAACAKATSPEGGDGDGDGDGDTVLPGSGGLVLGSGGSTLGSGGSTLGMGGATGGASTATGGTTPGSGGTTFEGACADLPPVSGVSMTGAFGVHTCTQDRDVCEGVTLNEPAVFECIADHAPNCTSQTPQDGKGVWGYVGLCSEYGMGGSTGSTD